jgi:eukaryotic-like serine/threonine-protein kinase
MTPLSLTPSQWAVVSAEFPALLATDTAARTQHLTALSMTDAAVAAELRSLLAAADADDGMLERVVDRALTDWQPTAAPSVAGRMIGPWTLTREIGRGGMGVVYEGARAGGEFDKRVAIKTLAMGVQRPELLWRFRRERQILAGLSHPNITTLFDGGATDDGVPYLVMEFVDGMRIDAWCDSQGLSLRERLDSFRTVCAAVQFAHSKLIVHRDLKPGNILVTGDGVVKLLDFGVAKLLAADDADTDATRTGLAPLTTAYASPEQARGESVTIASDVYALGVLLYRLLTGASPYDLDGKTASEAMHILSTASPRLPSDGVTESHARHLGGTSLPALRSVLTGELDAIVLMALRKEPDRRYATVQALSDDVLRYLKGETVAARPERFSYTLRAFVRRNRGLTLAALTAIVSMLVGTGVSIWQARRAQAEAARATRVRTMLEGVLGASDPFSYNGIRAGGSDVPLRVVIDSAAVRVATAWREDPATRADLYRSFAGSYANLDQLDLATQWIDSARVLHERTSGTRSLAVAADRTMAAMIQFAKGEADSSLASLELLREQSARAGIVRDSLRSLVLVSLAQVRQITFYDTDSAASLATSALRLESERTAPRLGIVAQAEGVLAVAEAMRGHAARSDSLIEVSLRHLSADSSQMPAVSLEVLAYAGFATYVHGALPASEAYWRQAHATAVRVFGPRHPLTAESQAGLSWTLLNLGKLPEGKALADSALATHLARTHRNAALLCAMYRQQMSYALATRDTAAAVAAQRLSAAELPATGGQRPFLETYLMYATAALQMQQHDTVAAWHSLDRAATVMRTGVGPAHPLSKQATARLIEFSGRVGRNVTTGERVVR